MIADDVGSFAVEYRERGERPRTVGERGTVQGEATHGLGLIRAFRPKN